PEESQFLLNALSMRGKKTYGYGLKNVNDRLISRYGSEYALRIESAVGQGTAVFIRIPLPPQGKESISCR
ncbi:MAG: hypothetical protein RR482_02710, partial [Clostridia bacterium]